MNAVTVNPLTLDQWQELHEAQERFDQLCRTAQANGGPLPPLEPYLATVSEAVRPRLEANLSEVLREYAPVRVPGYELGTELGHGGMGVVYRARAADGSVVAVKIIKQMEGVRLQRLRDIWTGRNRLNHPNIAGVTEVGTHAGRVYLVMPLVEGQDGKRDLRARSGEFTLDPQVAPALSAAQIHERKVRIARILEKVARAVHHLHQRAIIHRDVKPSNILLDERDEPLLCDLDLARPLEGAGCTIPGEVLGTPEYMAFEQLAGREDLTVAVDVWGLGGVLYYLLVGHAPYCPAGTTPAQVRHRPANARLVVPSEVNPRMKRDHDLEWISLRCLTHDPDHRPSARELADWLCLYQNGQRVRPAETVSRVVQRWVGEHLRRPMVEPEYLARWRNLLRIEGVTSLVCHAGMFALAQNGVFGWWLWVWFVAFDTLLSWFIWSPAFWGRRLSPMEREVIQLWSGADVAVVVLLSALLPLNRSVGPDDLGPFYTAYAVVRGLIFFIEGRVCWDRLYAPGIVFFGAALVMRLVPGYAPLLHGVLYAGWFWCLSFMFPRRDARDRSEAETTPYT